MAVNEGRKVALRERRLLVGDGIQCQCRIGDDPFAIALGNRAVFFDPLGFQPASANTRGSGTDLVLRFQRNALGFQAAVIDPRIDVALRQRAVHMIGPALAPLFDQRGLVPVADLCAKTILGHFAHRQHDMGVGLCLAILANIPMDIEIGDHAFLHELGFHEFARQLDVVFLRQLAGKGELDLAGELGILALFGSLDRVPQSGPVGKGFGRAFGQHHFGMKDACLVGEIMGSVDALIVQSLACAIGSGCYGTASARPSDDLCAEVKDCHVGNPVTLQSLRRHDV